MTMLTNEQSGFLSRRFVASIATADAHGSPHVVPICFAIGNNSAYIVTGESDKRARNVKENPQSALVADYYEDDWNRIGYVLIKGAAKILKTGEEYEEAVQLLRDRYPQFQKRQLFKPKSILALRIKVVVGWGDLTK